MPSRDSALYFVDIFQAACLIWEYSEPFEDAQALLYSRLHWDAVIREFEILGEAVNHLIKAGILDASYRIAVDFRNKVAHEYFGIDEAIVFDLIKNELPKFVDALRQVVRSFDLEEAVEDAIAEGGLSERTVNCLKHHAL